MSYVSPAVLKKTDLLAAKVTSRIRQRAEKAANEQGVSLSDWVRAAIEKALTEE